MTSQKRHGTDAVHREFFRDTTADVLCERLNKLERANHRWRSIGTIALVLGTAAFLVGTTGGQPKTVAAERFALYDQEGRVRAELGTWQPAGGGAALPRLALFDAGGTARAVVRLGPDGMPAVALADAAGTERLGMRLRAPGVPSISLSDQKGNARASFCMMPFSGNPRAGFFDTRGKAYWQAP